MEVHRCRFVEYQPAAINALNFTPPTAKQTRLAVGRANGNIEIWDPAHRYRLEKTIPGGKDLSVETLVWAHQSIVVDQDQDDEPEEIERELEQLLAAPPRLFSSGLNPYIVEWDTTSLTAKKSVDSNGGAVWCLAVNSTGTRLAAGCEDGCIRLFDITDNSLEYMRSFEAQKGRILSVSWSPEDDFIVSGGSDSSIRIWNVVTGRAVQRMTVNKIKKEHTLVWSVVVLKDKTIVSGDSLGNLMFWDAERGTLKQSHKAHSADILSVVASRDGDQVFSAGVDRKLTCFRRVQQHQRNSKNTTAGNWVNIGSRRYHWHDIRALALDDRPSVNSIVSGGVDVELVACPAAEFPQLIQNRLPPFPHKYLIALSKSQKLIMSTFFNSISLWRLGKAGPLDLSTHYRNALPQMLEPHQLVLDLQLNPDCNITSSALSENAEWISVADIENIRLFHVTKSDTTPGQLDVKKDRSFESALNEYLQNSNASSGAHHVLFTPGSDRLIVVTVESRILVIDLVGWKDGSFEVLREFGHHRGPNNEGRSTDKSKVATVISLAVSADGQWLATADDDNRIHVFNLDSLKHHIKLPRSSIPHTALSFNDFRPNELCVGLASNEFYIYNVEKKRLTDWSKAHTDQSDCKLLEQRDRIRGMAYNPGSPDKMVLYGSTYLAQVDLKNTVPKSGKHQKRKFNEDTKASGEQTKGAEVEKAFTDVQIAHKYQQILYCGFLDRNSMVMIERPKFSVLEKLPPSYYKAQFGT
ncbi:WD40-repeat-containing domain protein [Phycomyces nitens]|nr:WD40-repeat-containing domain protein [Phycomyces nitens]